jgi:hypothetical protein
LKHKNDVFRIVSTFAGDVKFEIPETIKNDLRTFLEMVIKDGLGTAELSKELGLEKEIKLEEFVNQFKNSFGL